MFRKELGLNSSFRDIFTKEKIYSNNIRNEKKLHHVLSNSEKWGFLSIWTHGTEKKKA